MEHRLAGGFDKRMADDPIYCLSDKFSLHIGFLFLCHNYIIHVKTTIFLARAKMINMDELIDILVTHHCNASELENLFLQAWLLTVTLTRTF